MADQILSTKSIGLSIFLTVLFGPFGMLYSTVSGGITMLIITIATGVPTMGLTLFVMWPACIVWGAIATHDHNKEYLSKIRFLEKESKCLKSYTYPVE